MKKSSNRLFATIVASITLALGGGALALLNSSASAATGGADGISEACTNGVLTLTNTSGSDGFLTNLGGVVFVAAGATVPFPGTSSFSVYAEEGFVIGIADYDPTCVPPPVEQDHIALSFAQTCRSDGMVDVTMTGVMRTNDDDGVIMTSSAFGLNGSNYAGASMTITVASGTIVSGSWADQINDSVGDFGSFSVVAKDCPQPPTVVAIPASPPVSDPCGANNATRPTPADTDQLDWTLGENGHLTVTVKGNLVFTDDTTSHDYGAVVDSGVTCPVTPTPHEDPIPVTV